MATVDFASGFSTSGQFPLNSKTKVKTLAELSDLGVGNSKAFKYDEYLEIFCLEDKNKYIWREVIGSEVGLLTTNFTYPEGAIADGIDYSNRTFNFFISTVNANNNITVQENICWTINPPQETVTFNKTDNADITLPENRDIIIPTLLEITRDVNRGIFNIAMEGEFDNNNFTSPAFTEWAVGTLSDDVLNLNYDTWNNSLFSINPPISGVSDIVGITFVVKSLLTDEYFQLTFTSWTSGGGNGTGGGGGFGYTRTELFSEQDISEFGDKNGIVIKELDSNNVEIVNNRIFIENSTVIEEPNGWTICNGEGEQNNKIQEITLSFSGATPPTEADIINTLNNFPPITVEEDVNLVINIDFTQQTQS